MKKFIVMISMMLVCGVLFAGGASESGDTTDFDGIRSIEIDAGTFEVEVQGSRGRGTTMEVRNDSDNFRVLHSVSGDTLEIWVEGRFSFFRRQHHGKITIFAPGDADLQIRTSTGHIEVQSISSDQVRVDTSTGRITLHEVTAPIRVESTTGEIDIRDSAGSFDITTTTGSIELVDTTGDIFAHSSTGGHVYRNVIGDLRARSSTGRIRIDGSQGTLDVETSTGTQEGVDISLTGNSYFESSTGSIEMDFTNKLEDLEFDLRSTTGSLRVGREESQRQLFLGGTGFTVFGKSSTGSQEYQ